MDVLSVVVPLGFGAVLFGLLFLLTALVGRTSPGARPASGSARST